MPTSISLWFWLAFPQWLLRLAILSICPFYWQFVYLHWCYVYSSPLPPPPLIYLYLILAVLGLHCCVQAFNLVEGERGLLFRCVVWASHCGCFSCGARASVVVAHRLNCSTACGILPGPGIKPVSPVLASEFLTTGLPVKSLPIFKLDYLSFYCWIVRVLHTSWI